MINSLTLFLYIGSPIAGYLLQAGGGKQEGGGSGVDMYRPAIFYAGGVATISAMLVLFARIKMAKKMIKRV